MLTCHCRTGTRRGTSVIHGWSVGPNLPSPVGPLDRDLFSYRQVLPDGWPQLGLNRQRFHPSVRIRPFFRQWDYEIGHSTYPDNQMSDMACGVLNDSGTDYIYCVAARQPAQQPRPTGFSGMTRLPIALVTFLLDGGVMLTE